MIETADTDYAADHDIDYVKPIKSRCFYPKSPKIAYLTQKNFLRPFWGDFYMMIGIGGADYSHRYRLHPIPLIIGPITSIIDVSVQLCSERMNEAIQVFLPAAPERGPPGD